MNLPLLSLFLSLSFPLIAPYHFYKATFGVQQKIEKYVNLINTTTVRKINLFRNTISNPFSHPLISLPTMEPPSLFHYQTKTKKDKKKHSEIKLTNFLIKNKTTSNFHIFPLQPSPVSALPATFPFLFCNQTWLLHPRLAARSLILYISPKPVLANLFLTHVHRHHRNNLVSANGGLARSALERQFHLLPQHARKNPRRPDHFEIHPVLL